MNESGRLPEPEPPTADAGPLEDVVPQAGTSQLVILVALLLAVGFLLAFTLTTIRRDAFFRLEATTEFLEIHILTDKECGGGCQSGASGSGIALTDLAWDVSGSPISVDGESGTFEQLVAGAGSRIRVWRSGSGPLVIEIQAPDDAAVAAVLREADEPVAIKRGFARLETDPASGRSYTLPYFGAATVGSVVRSAGTELLLDGSVSIFGSTTIAGDRFVAGTIPLRMGDEVRITDADGCHDAGPGQSGIGVARVGALPGISVVHEARADALRISRAGAEPHCFRASLWSFLSADPLIGGLLLFALGVLIALVQNVITFLVTGVAPLGRGRVYSPR